jgi:hypothetical protein
MNKYKRGLGQGWRYESQRHSLASRGIKTRLPKLNIGYSRLGEGPFTPYKSHVEYAKLDGNLVSKLQEFLHIKLARAQDKKGHLIGHPEVVEAQRGIEQITSWGKFREWLHKHRKTIALLGLGGLLGIAGAVSGVPTMMMNTATGEIVAVGGTLLGKYGMIGETILTGAGVMEEAKVITADTNRELAKDLQKDLVGTGDFTVLPPKERAYIIRVSPKRFDTAGSDIAPDSAEYGDLEELSSPPIPWGRLTPQEKKVLFTSIKKVKRLFKSMGKEVELNQNNLQVVKRVGPDDSAWGAHQDSLIQIDRDILKNPDKSEGVMAHETLHKTYGVRDETRDLENLQIDYMGKLM